MYNLSFTEKVGFEKNDKIMTYFGIDKLGKNFFCYILCSRDGFKKMQDDYLSKTQAPPKSYGKIIYLGDAPEPDEKAKLFLQNWLKNNA